MNHLRTLLALSGVVLCASGCIGRDEVPASVNTTTTIPPPVTVALGQEVSYFGITATVSHISADNQSTLGFPVLRVVVQSQNTLDSYNQNPNATVVCDESSLRSDWFAQSTWEPNQSLEPLARRAGELVIAVPAKETSPTYSVAQCSNAMLEFEFGRPEDAHQRVRVAVDPAIISDAIRRPRGTYTSGSSG